MVLCNDGRKSTFQYLPFKPRTFRVLFPHRAAGRSVFVGLVTGFTGVCFWDLLKLKRENSSRLILHVLIILCVGRPPDPIAPHVHVSYCCRLLSSGTTIIALLFSTARVGWAEGGRSGLHGKLGYRGAVRSMKGDVRESEEPSAVKSLRSPQKPAASLTRSAEPAESRSGDGLMSWKK